MTPALVLVLLLSLPFLWVLARRPVLRRLAVRNAAPPPARGGARRPRLAPRRRDHHRLDGRRRHDERVDPPGRPHPPRPDRRDRLDARARSTSSSCSRSTGRSRARTATSTASCALAWMDGCRHDDRPAHPLGAALAGARGRLRGRPALRRRRRATGIAGPTPAPGHAAISSDLARALGLRPGARIAVHAFGLRTRARRRPGPAPSWDRRLLARRRAGVDERARLAPHLRPHHHERRRLGRAADLGDRGLEPWRRRERRVPHRPRRARHSRRLPGTAARAADLRGEADNARHRRHAVGKGFTSMFTAMGSFGVLAGLLLLVNLFVMLAAERKTELGMARAVGMRRSELVGVFATEGWLYALTATALGVLIGIGLGRILVAVSARVFSTRAQPLRPLLHGATAAASQCRSRSASRSRSSRSCSRASRSAGSTSSARSATSRSRPRRQGRLLWVVVRLRARPARRRRHRAGSGDGATASGSCSGRRSWSSASRRSQPGSSPLTRSTRSPRSSSSSGARRSSASFPPRRKARA